MARSSRGKWGTAARVCALAAALLPAGCIYRHTVCPLDTDFHATPVYDETGGSTRRKITLRSVDVEWASDAVGDAARRAGLRRVHYADLEELSILGIWNERTLHVYGEE